MAALLDLGRRAYGGPPIGLGAEAFSLDHAESAMAKPFEGLARNDCEDVLAITDPEDCAAYLLSMPPGQDATPEESERLRTVAREALRIVKRSGLVTRRKAGRAGSAALTDGHS